MNLFLSLVVSHWRQSNPDTVESDAVEAVAESLKTSSVVLSTRVYSALAGCVVRLDELPGKLNPVIKPIMDTLKREVRCVKCCNENLAGSDLVIMPYKVMNIRFITLYMVQHQDHCLPTICMRGIVTFFCIVQMFCR